MRRAILIAFRVLGLAVASALFVAWQLAPVPVLLKLVPASVLVLTLVRPAWGLLVMAGMGPVIGGWAVVLASPFGPTHAFEQLVLAVLIGTGCRPWGQSPPLRLTEPALLVAAVAVASAIATQPLMLLQQFPGVSVAEHVRILLTEGYFSRGMLGQPVSFAVMTAEGMGLAVVAERLVRNDPATAPQVVRMLVVGHAGLSLISIQRILGAALHTDDVLQSIARLLRDVRVSTYADLNAAGSVLAMVLVAGTGLLAEPSRSRWLVVIALPVIAVGLWISGSRTALVALGVVVVSLLIAAAVRRRGRVRWLAVGTTVAAMLIGLWTAASYPAARNVSASAAIRVRVVLAGVALDMWRSAPILGVGVGRFWAESSNFSGEALRAVAHTANENAHNNFLQVLAEEGLIGLGALLATLGTVFVAWVRCSNPNLVVLRRCIAAALGVFVLTWLGGHPLVLAEAGFAFWLLAGVLAGLTNAPTPGRWRTLVALSAVIVLVTGPVRADRAIRDAGFEYLGAGVSGWRPELDGVRYREAGATFQLYLPSDGTAVTLPLRRAAGAPDPLVITLRLGGQQLDQVRLTGDAWLNVPVLLPKANRRFELVGFTMNGVEPSPSSSTLVLVGKTVVRSR